MINSLQTNARIADILHVERAVSGVVSGTYNKNIKQDCNKKYKTKQNLFVLSNPAGLRVMRTVSQKYLYNKVCYET